MTGQIAVTSTRLRCGAPTVNVELPGDLGKTLIDTANPTVAAALISAVVSLVVALVTTLAAPGVKYNLDRRLERRKLELAYTAEQSRKLRDHIGRHKGTIFAAARGVLGRVENYHEVPEAAKWLRGAGYYRSSFAFRILRLWAALDDFSRQAIYLDAEVATPGDWAFVRAIMVNQTVWTDVNLTAGSGAVARDHFFQGQVDNLVEALRGSDGNLLTWTQFEESAGFETLSRFLGEMDRDPGHPKYQRLVAAYLLLAATMNTFGYEHLRVSADKMRTAIDNCAPAVREQLRDLITDIGLNRETGFRDLIARL